MNFQDLIGFRSSFTLIWKMLTSLDEKLAKIKNCDFLVFYKIRNNFFKELLKKLRFGQEM